MDCLKSFTLFPIITYPSSDSSFLAIHATSFVSVCYCRNRTGWALVTSSYPCYNRCVKTQRRSLRYRRDSIRSYRVSIGSFGDIVSQETKSLEEFQACCYFVCCAVNLATVFISSTARIWSFNCHISLPFLGRFMFPKWIFFTCFRHTLATPRNSCLIGPYFAVFSKTKIHHLGSQSGCSLWVSMQAIRGNPPGLSPKPCIWYTKLIILRQK